MEQKIMSFASILWWKENKWSTLASEKQSCWHQDPVQGHISPDEMVDVISAW